MNKKRIGELADFFYSANNSNEVPFRLIVSTGMCGMDLTKNEFRDLLYLLENSENLYEDTKNFAEENYYSGI